MSANVGDTQPPIGAPSIWKKVSELNKNKLSLVHNCNTLENSFLLKPKKWNQNSETTYLR